MYNILHNYFLFLLIIIFLFLEVLNDHSHCLQLSFTVLVHEVNDNDF